MKAIVFNPDLGLFQRVEKEMPKAEGNDLLVKIKAIGLNPIDAKVRKKETKGNPPRILGWDASGEVISCGKDVSKFQAGDEVYYSGTLNRPGAYADFQCVHEDLVGHKPKSLSFEEAAALPLTTITAWELLFDRMQVSKDKEEDLLVVGASGGVGSILLQLAHHYTKLRLIATASTEASKNWCLKNGAHLVLDHSKDLNQELDLHQIKTLPYIALLASTSPYFEFSAKRIAPLGTIGALVDATSPLDLNLLKAKSVRFVWEFMFARSVQKTSDQAYQGEILDTVSSLLDKKILKTTLNEVRGELTPENIQKLHEELEAGHNRGKIVLKNL